MNKLHKYYFLILLLLFSINCWSAFSGKLFLVEKMILDLELDEAQKLLNEMYDSEKNNPQFLLLKHYAGFVDMIISENPEKYTAFKESEKKLIRQLNSLENENEWNLFSIAEIKLQSAFIKLKMGDRAIAFKGFRDAYILLKKNQSQYPDFIPNLKSLGWIEATVGSLPDNYDWLKKMTGLSGSIKTGEIKLDSFCRKKSLNVPEFLKWEGWFTLTYVNIHLAKNTDKAELLLLNELKDMKQPLGIYMKVLLWNALGNNEKVLSTLNQFRELKTGTPVYYLDFLEGQSKIRKLDLSGKSKILKFLKFHEGKNYRKRAYLLLAIASRIEGNMEQTELFRQNTMNMGVLITEEDKQAQKEATHGITLCVPLLKSRLLYDGNYYNLSLEQLELAEKCSGLYKEENVEIIYRKAGIYNKTGNIHAAKIHYQETIMNGMELSKYYACNAALQMGLIYEKEKNKIQAKYYFEMVLTGFPKNKEYINSLTQKAKSGLQRILETD